MLSAFAWTSPSRPRAAQLTCAALPQGRRNSPHLLGAALGKDLGEMPSSEGTVSPLPTALRPAVPHRGPLIRIL